MEDLALAETQPMAEERRVFPRYSPDPLVPVLFAHPDAAIPSAGLISDVSRGGVRIIGPPMARPFLHWSDPLRIEISYSDSAREAGIEGLRLRAHVVKVRMDARAYLVHAAFTRDGADGDWDRLTAWIARLAR
jgi:hypothetical protein